MKIAFVTTQSRQGSTVAGRILPLGQELAVSHKVHVIVHGTSPLQNSCISWHSSGKDPWQRTATGKKRLEGLPLLLRLLANSYGAYKILRQLKPEAIVIVKALPENVLAVGLYNAMHHVERVILDVDDFELAATVTSSWLQRAALHASERWGAALASAITAATPFLLDHMEQLTQKRHPVYFMPTGPIGVRTDNFALSSVPTITYIGSLSQSSGHRIDMLPEMFAKVRQEVPNARLFIIGGGDDESSLRQELTKRGLAEAAAWLGRFEGSDVRSILEQTAVLVDPVDSTIVNRAKSSFRVMIAGAYGVPVVTSNVGIRSQLLPASLHTRFFARSGEADDYAQKISALLKGGLTEAESQTMKTHVAPFAWSKLAQTFTSVLA